MLFSKILQYKTKYTSNKNTLLKVPGCPALKIYKNKIKNTVKPRYIAGVSYHSKGTREPGVGGVWGERD